MPWWHAGPACHKAWGVGIQCSHQLRDGLLRPPDLQSQTDREGAATGVLSPSLRCLRLPIRFLRAQAPAAFPTTHKLYEIAAMSLLQAISLRTKLEKLAKLDGAVWVTSPLTRAMETFLLSCPKRHLLASGPSQAADSARIKVWLPVHSLTQPCPSHQPHLQPNAHMQVAIRPELTEHLVTTGDIGMPRTWLTERFPEVRLVTIPLCNKQG